MRNEQRRRFEETHQLLGSRTLHHYALDDGDLWFAEQSPGVWAFSFYSYRRDHPDAPELASDTERVGLDGTRGADAVGEQLRLYLRGRDPRELLDVALEEAATPGEIDALSAVLDELGFPARVRGGIGRRSLGDLPWIVVITVPAGSLAAGFFGKAGADAWDVLKNLARAIYSTRLSTTRGGSIVLEDGDRTIVFSNDLPDRAYEALADLDEVGYYIWEPESTRWRKLP